MSILKATEHLLDAGRGVRLRVIEYAGPERPTLAHPVVFIAGWVSHLDGWTGLIEGIACQGKLFYVETRDKPSAELSGEPCFAIAEQARDLAAVLRALALPEGRFYTAASSTGANILLQYLLNGRHAPKAAALMIPMRRFRFPAGGFPYLYLPHKIFYGIKPLIKAYIKHFRSDPSGERKMLDYNYYAIDRLEPRRTQRAARDLMAYRFPDRLETIRTPCIIVKAGRDKMHGGDVADDMAARIAVSRLCHVPESGFVHTESMAEILVQYFRGFE